VRVYVLYEPDSQAVLLNPSTMWFYTSPRKARKERDRRNREIGWDRWAVVEFKVQGRK